MKPIYWFEEAKSEIVKYIGSKAWKVGQLVNLELGHASGFILSSSFSKQFLDKKTNSKLSSLLLKHLVNLEKTTGRQLDSNKNPLILQISASSFDGLLDNIQDFENVGLNDESLQGLLKQYQRPKFAYTTYIQFICDFLQRIYKIEYSIIESQINGFMSVKRVQCLQDLEVTELKELVQSLKNIAVQQKQLKFPESTLEQLEHIILSFGKSWNTQTLCDYKQSLGFDLNVGLPIIVREQKFATLGENSAQVLVQSKNPLDGKDELIVSGYNNKRLDSNLPIKKSYTAVKSLLGVDCSAKIQEYIKVLETYFCNAVEVNIIIEDTEPFVSNVKILDKSPKAEAEIALALSKTQNKEMIQLKDSINLNQLKDYFKKIPSTSSSAIDLADCVSLNFLSAIGEACLAGNPRNDGLLFIKHDHPELMDKLLNFNAVVVSNLNSCQKTIYLCRTSKIPCFLAESLSITKTEITTQSGVKIKPGAKLTLNHIGSKLLAGAIEFEDVKCTKSFDVLNTEVNLNLAQSFGLLCFSLKDAKYKENFKSNKLLVNLNDFGAVKEKSQNKDVLKVNIRSDISFFCSKHTGVKINFRLDPITVRNDLELTLIQIEALIEMGLNKNRLDDFRITFAGACNNYEYKMLLDWLAQNLSKQVLSGFKQISKFFEVTNLELLSHKGLTDERFDGFHLNLDRLLQSFYQIENFSAKDSFSQRVLSRHLISNIRSKENLNELVLKLINDPSENLKFSVQTLEILNDEWLSGLHDLSAECIYCDKRTLLPNKIITL